MIITALKQQVKNPGRVSIFVDGAYSFSLSLDVLARYKIKNGDEFSETDVKRFQKVSVDGKMRDRALEWLLNRPHSTREFNDYLRRKKTDTELAEKLVEEFSSKGYLSDEKYATWLVELRSAAGKSNRAIAAELASKGIDRELAAQALGSASEEAERLKALIAKKQKLSRYQNDPPKFIKYLTSQGFSYQLVKDQLKINQPED